MSDWDKYLMEARKVYGIRVYWKDVLNQLMKYFWAGVSVGSALGLMKNEFKLSGNVDDVY